MKKLIRAGKYFLANLMLLVVNPWLFVRIYADSLALIQYGINQRRNWFVPYSMCADTIAKISDPFDTGG